MASGFESRQLSATAHCFQPCPMSYAIFPETGSKLIPEPPGPHTVPIILKETHQGEGREGMCLASPLHCFPLGSLPRVR